MFENKQYYVIDMHCHVADPEVPKRIAAMGTNNPNVEKVFNGIQRFQEKVGWYKGMIGLNPTPENFVKIMEESRTDLGVLAMLGFKEELDGIELSSSDYLAKVISKYGKDTYLAYAGVDPRSDDAAEKVEYFIKEKGFIGIRINPNDWGTFPLDSPMLKPIYEKCAELDVPIHIHTGTDPTGIMENGNPILLDKIAIKYPDLKIFLEHYGFPWKYTAYSMCQKHENVYLTLAWVFNVLVHHNKFLAWQELEEMRIYAGIDKIMYGSDFPATPNLKEVIDFLKYEEVSSELKNLGFKDWTYEMRAKVLGLNAANILNIKNEKIEKIKKTLIKSSNESESTIEWSKEANKLREHIPPFIKKSAVNKIESYAREHEIEIVTPEVMEKARNS